jgi:hypothetical protein
MNSALRELRVLGHQREDMGAHLRQFLNTGPPLARVVVDEPQQTALYYPSDRVVDCINEMRAMALQSK